MRDWKTVKLGDLIEIKHGYAFKGEYFRDEPTKSILLTPGNFAIGGGFQMRKLKYYDGPIPDEYILESGDLLVTMTDLSKKADTLGYSAVVPDDGNTYLHNQRLGKVTLKDESFSLGFFHWLMRTNRYRQEVLASRTGSTVKHTSPSRIYEYRFPAPPIPVREFICETMDSLNLKIELNRRTNETLEAMAQAIFKDWFVDFGPVRRKMEGASDPVTILGGLISDPEKAAETAALFPDTFGDNGLPEGWGREKLGQHLTVLESGKRPRGGAVIEGVPSVGAESIKRVGVFDFDKTKFVPAEFFQAMRKGVVENGDVLVYKDGGKPGELRPAVSLVSNNFPFARFCINEHVFRLRSDSFSPSFFYCLLSTADAFWQMRENATGVAQPGLNQGAMKRLSFVMPSNRRLVQVAGDLLSPLIEGCNTLAQENRGLAATRDYLLPKLMSGEIRAGEVEGEVA